MYMLELVISINTFAIVLMILTVTIQLGRICNHLAGTKDNCKKDIDMEPDSKRDDLSADDFTEQRDDRYE